MIGASGSVFGTRPVGASARLRIRSHPSVTRRPVERVFDSNLAADCRSNFDDKGDPEGGDGF